MRELKIKIEDNYDIVMLLGMLNTFQERVLDRDIQRIATITVKNIKHPFVKQWSDETINELNRMQAIKEQLESAIIEAGKEDE